MNKKYKENRELDHISLKIIEILRHEGRLPVTEIAKRIGISKTPCQSRITRLQNERYILGFRATINHAKLNQEHVAFAEIKLSDTRKEALDAFNEKVLLIPEVEECHLIASSFDYLLKIRTSDISAYRRVLGESVSALPHVAHSSTHISMQSIRESSN